MIFPILNVALVTDHDLVLVRHRTKKLAALSGITGQDQNRLVTATSEIARNILLYAGRGRARFEIADHGHGQILKLTLEDNGPGIPDIHHVLHEKVISSTGLGIGIRGAKKLVDLFDIESTPGKGTTVQLGKSIPSSRARISSKEIASWMSELETEAPVSAVDELQQQNQQLLQALEQLQSYQNMLEERTLQIEAADRMKSEFLANISHEIRTPINAIIGIGRMLGRTNLEKEQRRLVALLHDSGETLLRLINDILDLSKIEAGKLVLEESCFDLHELITTTADMMQTQALERGLSVRCSVTMDTPRLVLGDWFRIRQVLLNLLSNAIKFSSKGHVVVQVSRGPDTTGDITSVRFSVMDKGIGISEEQQKRLFQPFVQLDGANDRKYGGTGLGLSICKRLVEMMGGQIGVLSEMDRGSTFWFHLPLTVANSREETCEPIQRLAEPLLGRGRVLLVEDHPVSRMVAAAELEELGMFVSEAEDGRQAVEMASGINFDLILMDCQMPGIDGFEATRLIRENEKKRGRRVPIVAMTASAMDRDRDRCLACGMDDFVGKPFEIQELKSVIERWCLPVTQESSPVNIEFLSKRYRGQRLPAIVQAFLEDTEHAIKSLQKHFGNGDCAEIAKLAHQLSGSCGLLYASELQDLFSELEQAAKENATQQIADILQELPASFDRARSFLDGYTSHSIPS